MTNAELDAIESRALGALFHGDCTRSMHEDMPRLVMEVRRLRALYDDRGWLIDYWRERARAAGVDRDPIVDHIRAMRQPSAAAAVTDDNRCWEVADGRS